MNFMGKTLNKFTKKFNLNNTIINFTSFTSQLLLKKFIPNKKKYYILMIFTMYIHSSQH